MTEIEKILFEGTNADRKELFSFYDEDTELIYKKFKYFSRYFFTRYFTSPSSELHKKLAISYLKTYLGIGLSDTEKNFIIKGFRGCAKTATMKLVMVFVLSCDGRPNKRMYNKILSRDIKNSKQVVTDVFNMLLEVKPVFGEVFQQKGEKKQEKTMAGFTMVNDVKFTAGSVGQSQRGHVQDAYRPDFIWFDDIEDRESIASAVITQTIMDKIEEALDGMAPEGTFLCTANYISEYGAVEMIAKKATVQEMIFPIATDCVYQGKELVSCTPTWEERFPEKKIKEIQGDAEYWYSEYLCDPSREDDKLFDLDLIEEDLKHVKDPIRDVNGLRIWEMYRPNNRYGIGADVSEGVGRDSCTMALINFDTGELIATYNNNRIAPDLFAHEIAQLGSQYGNCIVAPEINNPGHATIAILRQIYNRIYKEQVVDRATNQRTNKYGWRTTGKSKHIMISDLRRDYEQGLIKIKDRAVLLEMKAYGQTDHENLDGKQMETRHFDLLIAVAIAWQMKKHATLERVGIPQHRKVRPNQTVFGGRNSAM